MAKVIKKVKPVAKKAPAKKNATKPVVKKVAKPAKKVAAKSKPTAKAPLKKVAVKAAPKKVAIKPTAKAVTKPAKKTVAKASVKTATKPIKKTAAKPTKKAPIKVAKKVATKPAIKTKATSKPTTKAKVATKPIAKKVAKPIAKPAIKKANTNPKATPKVAPKVAPKVIAKTKTSSVKKIVAKKPLPPVNPIAKKVENKPIKKAINLKKIESTPVLTSQKPKIEILPAETRIVRYSDADLVQFKEVILKKIAKAKDEVDFYTEQIKNASESQTEFASIDDGSSTSERENMNQIVVRMLKLISHLESALVRIENKSYGICRETGRLIPKERLLVVPHATLSVEGKKMEKK